jgi:hypothetical protein
MISYKTWKEYAATATAGQSEQPTADDFNFYQTQLSGKVRRYLQTLVTELERTNGKMSLVKKGFIMQEVMDSLGLDAGQVTRLSNNIKRGFLAWQAAKSRMGPAPAPIV